ncbi:sigma factor, partial [Frankia nepalensis]|uniref:sigma factor n=1 Tax=Frankia nepalensis TaxID=1836974 RepID=UPI002551E2E7
MADDASFDAFYRQSRQRLYDCLYALTGDPAEAQDAAQEAFARAWQRWPTVGGYDDPEAWVRTVGRRIARCPGGAPPPPPPPPPGGRPP